MFAAQVGWTNAGGDVYDGALVDRRLGHGAIVFSAIGTSDLRVGFHAFFARGSIGGSGTVAFVPGAGGRATFKGLLRITGGTSAYRHATGKLTTAGNLDNTGRPTALSRARSSRNDNPQLNRRRGPPRSGERRFRIREQPSPEGPAPAPQHFPNYDE